MKTKTGNLLPKMMSGSVHAQMVRCGKASCKCARGELHGAYYYLFVRVNGKLTKRYLKADEVQPVRAAYLAWHEKGKERRARAREARQIIRESSARLRDIRKQLGY